MQLKISKRVEQAKSDVITESELACTGDFNDNQFRSYLTDIALQKIFQFCGIDFSTIKRTRYSNKQFTFVVTILTQTLPTSSLCRGKYDSTVVEYKADEYSVEFNQ